MVELALVVFRQPVPVAIDKAAFALDTQQSYFLIAAETPLPVFLPLFLLERQLLHLLAYFLFGLQQGSRTIAGRLLYLLLLNRCFAISEWGKGYLKQEEQRPW